MESSKYLKSCVYTALQRAEELDVKSIAFPMISCGSFGGDPKICSKLICETISFFSEIRPESPIKQVHFADNLKYSRPRSQLY